MDSTHPVVITESVSGGAESLEEKSIGRGGGTLAESAAPSFLMEGSKLCRPAYFE